MTDDELPEPRTIRLVIYHKEGDLLPSVKPTDDATPEEVELWGIWPRHWRGGGTWRCSRGPSFLALWHGHGSSADGFGEQSTLFPVHHSRRQAPSRGRGVSNGTLKTSGIGSNSAAKEAIKVGFDYFKANANRVSASIKSGAPLRILIFDAIALDHRFGWEPGRLNDASAQSPV